MPILLDYALPHFLGRVENLEIVVDFSDVKIRCLPDI